MDRDLQELIFAALDGTIDAESFDRLQHQLEQSAEARHLYLECVELFESLGESDLAESKIDASRALGTSNAQPIDIDRNLRSFFAKHFLATVAFLAATILLSSAVAFSLGRNLQREDTVASSTTESEVAGETMFAGHASLRRVLDARWSTETPKYVSGDIIPEGKLSLEKGTIELEFFCGASLVFEGPASFDVISDWELTFYSGNLRANVPPAARGFVVNAAESKVVDLGTEFSLSVSTDEARVDQITPQSASHRCGRARPASSSP